MNGIKLEDKIYGEASFENKIFEELLSAPSVKRLKGISQQGIPEEYYNKKGFSRYEHTLGVIIILNKLGATEEEQVAGLLHDVSHTAFSHVIDWIFGDPNVESLQDENLLKFITDSEINEVLNKYNLSAKKLSELEDYELLDKEIPNLCADRLDYSLRHFPLSTAREIFEDLSVENNNIFFKSEELAKVYGNLFLDLQVKNWGSVDNTLRYYLLSEILKYALEKDIINESDMWQDDQYVLKLLKNADDEKISKGLKLLKSKHFEDIKTSSTLKIKKKFRYVDPSVLKSGNLVALSKIDSDFARRVDNEKSKNALGVEIPKIDI